MYTAVRIYCRYITESSSLLSLDVSGAFRLGNDGCFKVLQACCGRGWFEDDRERLCLKGCGMESPLPSELVKLLKSVLKGQQENAVDTSGNKIDSEDKRLMYGDYM